MAHPLGGTLAPATPFGRRGRYWGCLKDSAGNGIHTGADWPAQVGTPVYAVVDGDVRYRDYGSAFGLQLAVSPDGPGEWFYAHLSWRVADGTRVKAGDLVGRIGNTGNSTGPHLHLEWKNTKGSWFCGDHKDPWPEIQRLDRAAWLFPDGHKVYLSKLRYGGHESNDDGESDSIKALQEMLNRHPLNGGQALPVVGRYGPETDEEVRLCQTQHGFGADKPGESFVGPGQLQHLISTTGARYSMVDDRPSGGGGPFEGLRGVDISDHQSGLDIAKIEADFVIVKVTEGQGYTSPSWKKQYAAARNAGRLVGLYHFARNDLGGAGRAEAEADYFVAAVRPHIGEAVLVLDWERPPLTDVDWARRWLTRVHALTGVRPLVYLSSSVTKAADWSTVGADHPLWVAHYGSNSPGAGWAAPTAPEPNVNWPGGWTIWQYTSRGRLDGYGSDLDLNVAPGMTEADWVALATPAATPEPTKAPRFITANWPSRYDTGGIDADLALWRELTADPNVVVVALQEAWWLYNRVLRDRVTGWTFVTAGTSEGDVSGEVLAIRDSWGEIVDTGSTMISPYTDVQPEAAGPTRHKEKHIVWADVDVDGKVWYVGNVHLAPSKHLGGAIGDLWKRQRDACVDWIGRQGDLCVLLGDFNCVSDDRDATPFRRVARIASAPSHGKRDIDWIVVKNSPQAPTITDVRALPNRGQSDHRPVTATLVDAEEAPVTRAEFEALKTQVEAVEVKVDLLAKAAKVDREVVGDVQETITSHVPAALRGLADLLEDE